MYFNWVNLNPLSVGLGLRQYPIQFPIANSIGTRYVGQTEGDRGKTMSYLRYPGVRRSSQGEYLPKHNSEAPHVRLYRENSEWKGVRQVWNILTFFLAVFSTRFHVGIVLKINVKKVKMRDKQGKRGTLSNNSPPLPIKKSGIVR